MATIITITIPNDQEAYMIDGLKFRYAYQETITNPVFDASIGEDPSTNPLTIPNTQSIAELTEAMLREHLKKEATQGYIIDQWRILGIQEDNVNLT